MITKPIKAAGYSRVSSPIQVKEGESLENQRNQIKEFVGQKEGWQLVDTYSDEGLSGASTEHRPDFRRMIEDAKTGKFDVIVFYKLSRFARNARDYLQISHDLEQHGVQLASVKENIDPTNTTGKLIAGILALFAEWERETIEEQMSENKMIRWRDHRAFIGQPPYAYRWNKETKKIEVHESEAEMYYRIVRMYLDQGMSYKDISIQLNSEGIKCKRAGFASITIGYILKNPAYYGHYVVNQFVYEDSKRGAGTKRTKRKKPASETITFPLPALISKTRWDKIQHRIEFNTTKSKRKNEISKEYFLRDVLTCGRCGAKVKPRTGTTLKNGTVQRYYTCYWKGTSIKNIKVAGKDRCTLPFIPAKKLENHVWAEKVLMQFSWSPEKTFAHLFDPGKHEQQVVDLEETVARLRSELSRKQQAKDRIYKLMEDEKTDIDESREQLHKNQDERLEIKANLDDSEKRLVELRKAHDKHKELADYLSNNKQELRKLVSDIKKFSPEDKKRLIEAMLDGPIVVDYQDPDPDHPEDGEGPNLDIPWKFNPEILQKFVEEGKIQLDKNSSLNTSSTLGGRSNRNHKNPFSCRETGQRFLSRYKASFQGSSPYNL
jgi:site-specific DNA recombinase